MPPGYPGFTLSMAKLFYSVFPGDAKGTYTIGIFPEFFTKKCKNEGRDLFASSLCRNCR